MLGTLRGRRALGNSPPHIPSGGSQAPVRQADTNLESRREGRGSRNLRIGQTLLYRAGELLARDGSRGGGSTKNEESS